jgi:2-aminobenzoate-CoA ligase
VQNGCNLTGDAFSQDEEGCFHFVARNDDMIISVGYNIAGPEVEAVLLAHEAVSECAMIGLPDEARGEVVVAFVVLKPDVLPDEATAMRLQDHVKANIAPYKYPRTVRFLEALPKTQTGKIQRFQLKFLQ